MATPQLFYLTKQSANFPSLRSEESSEADIKLLVKQLCQESERIERQVGHGAELVCNLAHNNLTCEHLYFLTKLLLESDVHLFALDLSWNRIFVSTWHAFLPTVTQLLKIAKHVDFAGNYLPALRTDDTGMVEMLGQNASFAIPNNYWGNDKWVQQWTDKAQEFRRQVYRYAAHE